MLRVNEDKSRGYCVLIEMGRPRVMLVHMEAVDE